MSNGAGQDHIDGGYVLLARKILDSEIMLGPPLQRWLFVWMLLKANHRDWNNLKRGRLFTTIQEMREAMTYRVGYRTVRPTKDQIRNAYEALTKATMITTTKTTRGMIITICNYEHYQNPRNYESHSENHNEDSAKTTEGPHYKQEWKNKEYLKDQDSFKKKAHDEAKGLESDNFNPHQFIEAMIKVGYYQEEILECIIQIKARKDGIQNLWGYGEEFLRNLADKRRLNEWEKTKEREKEEVAALIGSQDPEFEVPETIRVEAECEENEKLQMTEEDLERNKEKLSRLIRGLG